MMRDGSGIGILTAVLAAGVLTLGGCAGKNEPAGENSTEQTRAVQETEPVHESGESQEEEAVAELPDSAKGFADIITSYTRASGTEGEAEAAKAIEALLARMGYETSLQAFIQEANGEADKQVKGTNVIAVKKADNCENGDLAEILYITAHHDAKPGIQGAEDDGAGVAVLLETARQISQIPSDTEIRFVTFSGEEDGRVGSRCYVEKLAQEERSRVIGQIQLDDLGYRGSDYLKLSTVDGLPTLLGDMLSETAAHTPNMGKPIPYKKDGLSDHNSFHTHGMAAVMLGQNSFAFENHSTQDRLELLDPVRLQQTAQLVTDVAKAVMGDQSGALLEAAYEGKVRQTAYTIQSDTVIPFDMGRNYVENMMCLQGTLESRSANEFGDTEEIYQYPVVWFGMETPLSTRFHYRNGFLEMVEILKQDTLGADTEQAREIITAALGEPTLEGTDEENRKICSWEDEIYHKFFSLEYGEDGAYHVIVLNYNLGKTVYELYDLQEGMEAAKARGGEATHLALLELVEKLVYPDDYPLVQFAIYSDGKSNSTGYTSAVELGNNQQMLYALDIWDVFDEEGNYREYNKTVRTAVHEYGHVLSLNAAQVDLTKQDDSMPAIFFDQETYGEDSYMRAFYQKFWKDMDVKSGLEHYKENPDAYVSDYGAGNLSEDFAESFMQFVLSSRPEDDSVASQKIRFFYDYEDMTLRRDFIRGNLSLEETGGRRIPDLKTGDFRVELKGNPTTGYSWDYSMDPAGIVEEVCSEFLQNDATPHRIGAGGVYLFDFAGVSEGTVDVTFYYRRPWESREANQIKVYRLTVDGQGRVQGEELQGEELQ